jgi:hypothetical protein
VDTGAKRISDDLDLEALMLRVRDAAMTGAASSGTVQPQTAGDGLARELDLIRVLEAQSDWNEHARQTLTALVDCIRALRDDWADVQAGLRRDINQLSGLVEPRRSTKTSRRSGRKVRPAGKRRPR